jgi:hypothetical protein
MKVLGPNEMSTKAVLYCSLLKIKRMYKKQKFYWSRSVFTFVPQYELRLFLFKQETYMKALGTNEMNWIGSYYSCLLLIGHECFLSEYQVVRNLSLTSEKRMSHFLSTATIFVTFLLIKKSRVLILDQAPTAFRSNCRIEVESDSI